MENYLEYHELLIILCGIAMGTIARFITLKVDTRQNPSFPSGYFISIIMGIIASALGAVAIPALFAKDFTAVTFLTLAIQHFREIRKTEMDSLQELEKTEYTIRGAAYIDGIAKTFESRYYFSLLTSFLVVLILKIVSLDNIILNILVSAISGAIIIYILSKFTKGKTIGDICNLTEGVITIDGSDLLVDGIFVSNVLGSTNDKELFLNEGVAIVIEPKNEKFRITLENLGQRHAMLFEATRTFGVKKYSFAKRSFKEGKVIITFVPILRQPDEIINVIKTTPVLENSRKIHTIMENDIGGNQNG